ncbi:EcsC family protein [Trichlorobacter ammonificans]|uniref:Peptidase n=1 Tax=Trichlorobacter ammonificans TaxID=2916410 RepID=A0ABM9D9R0_9BACT|nr:EcsC family protein [Trichlorobacter ammonificans]CAH2031954.1 Peptidase [Trichlorobacter ammonificans]
MGLSPSELDELQTAVRLLETPGLATKISSFVGTPLEAGLKKLPESWHGTISTATRKSIEKALDVALLTLDRKERTAPANLLHKVAVGVSGAAGGTFGLAALAVELPVSTTIMLRSIADIARSQGEDLGCAEARLQCVQVLALGGPATGDDGAETSYFAARAALSKAVSDAAAHLTRHGLSQQGAPALVRLISQLSARFSIIVSEKAAAQAVPLVGALGGAAINTLFIAHFQNRGQGHFTVRRLERLHGKDEVRRHYERLSRD